MLRHAQILPIASRLEAIATGSKKLLGAKGIATNRKDGRYYVVAPSLTRNKKLLGTKGHCY